jgi:hypothetical protein
MVIVPVAAIVATVLGLAAWVGRDRLSDLADGLRHGIDEAAESLGAGDAADHAAGAGETWAGEPGGGFAGAALAGEPQLD